MGASQGSVERAVLAQLSSKGRVGGRNPLSTLCSQTGQDSVPGKQLVRGAVNALAENGKIVVKRDGQGRITEILSVRPRRHVDRTELSPQAKRERMHAKGVPAYLPDSMCSDVEVRHVDPKRSTDSETERSGEPGWIPEGSMVDNLNVCLRALRLMADENGDANSTSVREVLLMVPGVDESRSGTVMKHLRGMGLYSSYKTGFQKSSYTVNRTIVEITQGMLDDYRESRRSRQSAKVVATPTAEAASSSPPEPDWNDESFAWRDVEPLDDSFATADPSIEDDVVVQLAEIVEGLEAENTRLQGIIKDQHASIVQLSNRCTRLTDELVGANEQIALAQAALAAERDRPRQVDDKVASILARHHKS